MASNTPSIRQINWSSILPQILIFGVLVLFWLQIDPTNGAVLAVLSYLILTVVLKKIIAKSHRKGMGKVRLGQFKDAIQDFKDSYAYFKENEWVDKYRSITMFSSSKMSYTEMAINNIAFCYGQIGDRQQSKEYYQKVLAEFPDSRIAKAALQILESVPEKKA